MSPHPIPAAQGGHGRQLYCAHYDRCLSVAVREKWTGFACTACPLRGTCDVQPDPPRAVSVAQIMIEAAPPTVAFSEGERRRATTHAGGSAWRNYREAEVAIARSRRRGR